MPGSLAGGPSGPGGSPVAASGGGAGNKAAADALVKAMIPGLHKALSAYPPESKEYKAVLRALSALTANFKGAEEESMVPAALLQLAQAQKGGGGRAPAQPPMPIKAAPPVPPGGPGAMPPV